MKLAHYFFREPFDWNNWNIHTLVIENPLLYRNFVSGMMAQQSGMDGTFVLSCEDKIVGFHKNAELITDVFCLDPCENKRIMNAIQKELAELANHEFPHELSELYGRIHAILSNVIFSCGLDFRLMKLMISLPLSNCIISVPMRKRVLCSKSFCFIWSFVKNI